MVGTRLSRVLVLSLFLLTSTGVGLARAENNGKVTSDAGPGCEPGRPAVAHLADGQRLAPQPKGGPIPCGMRTGFPGGETRIEVTNSGAVVFAPGGHQDDPQTTISGRGGVAISRDSGATWTLSRPLGMTWHQNDLETYVDRATGKFFIGVMQKNEPVQIPNDPEGSNPIGEAIQSDDLPADYFHEIPEGGVDTDPTHYPAAAATVATSHILASPDGESLGKTWSYSTTCCEIVNGAGIVAAKPPKDTEKPTGYDNVVYYCWRSSQTFHMRPPEGLCSRSLDGGATWQIRGHMNRPVLPVHTDECSTPGSTSNRATDDSELAGLPVAAPDGTLWALLRCKGKLYLMQSSDQAATWPVVREIPYRLGELRMDTKGNMYLMRAVTGADPKLLLSVSRNYGATWSEEFNLLAPGITTFESEGTAMQGGVSCCTNWFYDVRRPGHVAVAYSAHTAAQAPAMHGYITETRNALDALDGESPLFWSASVNSPDRPLKYRRGFPAGANGSTHESPVSAALGGPQANQLGMDIAPDGSPWASFIEDCGPTPESEGCVSQGGQTGGYAGRLRWRTE